MALLAGAVIFASCSRSNGSITMGSKSQFDSLSYALGNNVGAGLNRMMSDIPFDFDAMTEGVTEGALGTAKMTHPEALDTFRTFFMVTRPERAQAIAKKNAMTPDSLKTPDESLADPAMFESEEERAEISYAFGNDIGYNISQSGMPIQLVWIGKAMQDVRDGKAKMAEDAVNQYLQYYFMVKRPAENAEASKAWLEKTEKKSGVKKTESGLLYKVTDAGDASVMPKDPRDVVKVHYTGRTREGKVFDTSIFKNRSKEQQEMMRKQSPDSFDEKGAPKEADEPAKFPLNRVIKGWTEGLQLVGEGGKITLWIPSDLAYGTRGAGRDIGPNEALQFDVEVIEVIPYEEPAPADSTATTPAPAPAK